MGETLTIAGQKGAYTLSDRGTFLATDNLDLKLLLEGGKDLLNPYHVIVVKGDQVNHACAQEFSDWIISPATQRRIGALGSPNTGSPSSSLMPIADGLRPRGTRSLRARLAERHCDRTGPGCPFWHLDCPLTSTWAPRARHRHQHRYGDPDGCGRTRCGAAPLAKWTARQLDLIYTLRGMVIAQTLIAAPLIAGITMAGLLALPA